MALREMGMWKNVLGNTQFSLEAKSDESLIIRDIKVYNPSSNYATLVTDKSTVGYYRVGGVLGSHLGFNPQPGEHSHDFDTSSTVVGDVTTFAGLDNPAGAEIAAEMIGTLAASTNYANVVDKRTSPGGNRETLISLMRNVGWFDGYPVATGETFTISGVHQANAIVSVQYDIYDAPDVQTNQPNASKASDYLFVNYGRPSASITTSTDTTYATQQTTSEFPAFPYGSNVPARSTVNILAVLASTFCPQENDGTDSIIENYLKLIRNRTVLFDKDRNGILLHDPTTTVGGGMDRVGEGYSPIGNFSDIDVKPPYVFTPALEYGEGTELTVQLSTTIAASGQTITAADAEVGFVLKYNRG